MIFNKTPFEDVFVIDLEKSEGRGVYCQREPASETRLVRCTAGTTLVGIGWYMTSGEVEARVVGHAAACDKTLSHDDIIQPEGRLTGTPRSERKVYLGGA